MMALFAGLAIAVMISGIVIAARIWYQSRQAQLWRRGIREEENEEPKASSPCTPEELESFRLFLQSEYDGTAQIERLLRIGLEPESMFKGTEPLVKCGEQKVIISESETNLPAVPVLADAETCSQEEDTTGEVRESTETPTRENPNSTDSRGGGQFISGGSDTATHREMIRCWLCNGTGRYERYSGYPEHAKWDLCDMCEGTGLVPKPIAPYWTARDTFPS